MKIQKILNNNFVIVNDGENKIYGGKGIGFGKKVGDSIDLSLVNQKFAIADDSEMNKVTKYLEEIDDELIQMGYDIVQLAKIKTGNQLNESVVFAIADHLNSSIERAKADITIPNYMLWEIKKFYQVEFEIGEYANQLVFEKFGIKLPDDEAGFVATHIIDAQLENSNIDQVYKTAELIKGIASVVKYHFNVEFDEDSIYYYRFITHLKFFGQRLFNDYTFKDTNDDRLYDMIKKSYINSFACVEKISVLLSSKYSYTLSKEEIIYLTIHIENVIYKSKK